MLNLLIAKTESSQGILSRILCSEDYAKHKIKELDEFIKLTFNNYYDVDFIISDAETILDNSCELYSQIVKKGLASRLIVVGEVSDKDKLSVFLSDGIGCYVKDFQKSAEKISFLFEQREAEKQREFLVTEILSDNLLTKKVKQVLDKGDSRSLQKILVLGNEFFPLNMALLKQYYVIIMKTVFEFAEEKGIRHIEKKDVLAEIINKNDYESLKECAVKKITGIIHLVEVDKKNQKKMVTEYIKDYVDENYMKQDTNPGNIADRFGVSVSYIGMLFREQQKTTITKYIKQLRVSKAAELLTGTKLQIQTISNKVGYSDQNYFARIFKKQTGLSPGEYRNKGSQ